MKLAGALMVVLGLTLTPAGRAQAQDTYRPARCAWLAAPLTRAGLPVATFQRIAWRESGCAPTGRCVSTRTDLSCSRFGINLRGARLARTWRAWCGVSDVRQLRNLATDLRCARAAYSRMGLRPWR